MSGLWACIGPSSCTDGLSHVRHRGRFETSRREYDSPAGSVRLQQCDHAGTSGDGRAPARSAAARRYSIVFDGSLYNRDELSRLAAAPLSAEATDAQILLAVFERFGDRCIERLDGPFAFVIWDDLEKRLYAVRDRFGLRPLYVHAWPDGLAFASEIKQFFSVPGTRARLNVARALDFLVAGLTDHSTGTMFERVSRVPAGAMLRLDLRGWRMEEALPEFAQWYQLPAPGSLELDEAEAVERFRHLLTDSIRTRWREPGPRALCLSGGLDSSSIAGILAAGRRGSRNGHELVTFKARFGDEEFDETHLLQSVIELTGATSHQTLCTFREALRLIEALAWHLDEPFSRASLAAQWMLFEQAAGRGVRALLDGQGADEQLGGYLSMIREHQAHLAGADASHARASASSRSSLSRDETAHGAQTFSWLAPEPRQATLRKNEARHETPPRSLGQLCRDRMLHGDLPMMMRQNDRIGAAHGIETHVPFMSHQLVELSVALGDRHKLVGEQSKYLLRRAVDGLVPRPVVEHYFKGSYSKLEEGWLRASTDESWLEAVHETARAWPELLAEEGVRSLTRERAAADKETLLLLWRILCFGAWARRCGVT